MLSLFDILENKSVMQNKTVLAFLDDVYEDLELWYPKLRLEEAGYALKCAAPEIKTYTGKHGYPAQSDLLLKDAHSEDFCGLLVPGGFMPDKLRRDAKVLSLTREFFEQGKLVAFICHGGWIPISAKILKEQTRHRLARHQGRPGKRRRHLGERAGRRGRQPDLQPHAARPCAVRCGDGEVFE
jgi:hypothetical protein